MQSGWIGHDRASRCVRPGRQRRVMDLFLAGAPENRRRKNQVHRGSSERSAVSLSLSLSLSLHMKFRLLISPRARSLIDSRRVRYCPSARASSEASDGTLAARHFSFNDQQLMNRHRKLFNRGLSGYAHRTSDRPSMTEHRLVIGVIYCLRNGASKKECGFWR